MGRPKLPDDKVSFTTLAQRRAERGELVQVVETKTGVVILEETAGKIAHKVGLKPYEVAILAHRGTPTRVTNGYHFRFQPIPK